MQGAEVTADRPVDGRLQWQSRLPTFVDEPAPSRELSAAQDRRDGRVYVLDDSLRLAVEVALVTGRPLLLRGEPGSGKSSLAAYVARNLGWRFYEHVVTTRTEAKDLLWRYDAVQRLADAQVRRESEAALPDWAYVEPGVLWWAFDPDSAARRGAPPDVEVRRPAVEPHTGLDHQARDPRAVVLIDEIDKADPDVPNALLVPLGSSRFVVTDAGGLEVVRRGELSEDGLGDLLVVLTTNEERDLPPAFIRRCVVYTLAHPSRDDLVEIARRTFGPEVDGSQPALFSGVADAVWRLRREAADRGERPPSTAEFLDAVRTCLALGVTPDDRDVWQILAGVTLRKVGTAGG